jgi:hypothetical protein
MKNGTKNLLIISGIIPATFLAYLCVLGVILILPDIFEKWDLFKFLFSCSCLLALGGYLGFWISLLENSIKNKNTLKLILLIGGLISILFILYYKQDLALHVSTNSGDIGRLMIFIWPLIISLFLILKIIIENKKSNFEK